MSDYGVFEATSTDGHEEEQREHQATRDLARAIEAAREGFGDFLGAATDKDDYKDRLALVMNDLMQKVADSGVMPVPGVMRKVKAALRPQFKVAGEYNYNQIDGTDLVRSLQVGDTVSTDFGKYELTNERPPTYPDTRSFDTQQVGGGSSGSMNFSLPEGVTASRKQANAGVWSDEGVKQRVLSLDPNLPTPELVDAIMREMGDSYDSIDRESAFRHFSQVTGNDYDDYYNAWLAMPIGKYFSRKQAGLQWDKQDYNYWSYSSPDSGLDYWIKDRSDGKIGWSVFDYLSGQGDAGTASSFDEAEQHIEGFIGSQSPDGAFNQLGSRKQAGAYDSSSIPGMYAQWAEDQGLDPHSNETVAEFGKQFSGLTYDMQQEISQEFLSSRKQANNYEAIVDRAADDFERDTGNDPYTDPNFITQYLPAWASANAPGIAFDPALYEELETEANMLGYGYTVEGKRKQAFTRENLGNGYYGIFYSAPSGKTDVDIFDSGDSLLTELTGADSPQMARKQAVEYVDSISSPEFSGPLKQASDVNTDDQDVLQFFYQFEDEGLDVSASGDEQWEWLKSNIDYDVLQDAIDQADEYGEVSRSNIDAMAYDLQQNFFGSRKQGSAYLPVVSVEQDTGDSYMAELKGGFAFEAYDEDGTWVWSIFNNSGEEVASDETSSLDAAKDDAAYALERVASRKRAGGGNWEQSYDGSDEWKLTGNPQVVIMSEDDGFYLFNGVELVEVTDTLEQAMDLGESSHVASRKVDSRRKTGSEADSVEAIVEFLLFCNSEGISEESEDSLDLYNGDDEISQDDYNTIYDFIAGDLDDHIYTKVNNRYRQRAGSRRMQARDEYMEELKEWHPVEYNAFMESLSPGTVYEPGELEALHKEWAKTQQPFDEGGDSMTASRKKAAGAHYEGWRAEVQYGQDTEGEFEEAVVYSPTGDTIGDMIYPGDGRIFQPGELEEELSMLASEYGDSVYQDTYQYNSHRSAAKKEDLRVGQRVSVGGRNGRISEIRGDRITVAFPGEGIDFFRADQINTTLASRKGERKQALELGEWEEDLPGLGYAKATKTPGGGWEVYIWDEAGQNETLTPVNSSEEAFRLFQDTIKSYPGSGHGHIDF